MIWKVRSDLGKSLLDQVVMEALEHLGDPAFSTSKERIEIAPDTLAMPSPSVT